MVPALRKIKENLQSS